MPPTKNVNNHDKYPSPQCAPEEESLLVRQRLRNLCQLAIEIGLREGLLGNQKDINQPATEPRKNPIPALSSPRKQEPGRKGKVKMSL